MTVQIPPRKAHIHLPQAKAFVDWLVQHWRDEGIDVAEPQAGVVLLALAVGGALLFAHNEISGNGRPGTEVTVSIPQGSGVSVIAQKLKDAGVIRSAYLFRW